MTGSRIKTRKRDEKKQYDPVGFRDSILEGLADCGQDLEAVTKFLDVSSNKLDYKRYGVNLIEIIIAGGLLAPGGIIVQDGEVNKTPTCVFAMATDMEKIKAWEQVFIKITRRFKYLEKMHEEEMLKILVCLKGFTPEERTTLAQITALWVASGQVPSSVLAILINEHQVKDGTALEFLLETLSTLKKEKGGAAVVTAVKKSGLNSRLMEFFPSNNAQQTDENFTKTFMARELTEVVNLRKNQAAVNDRHELLSSIKEAVEVGEDGPRSAKEMLMDIKEAFAKTPIPEHEAIILIWNCVMAAVEWNKKEELLQDQALKHVKAMVPIFSAFTKTSRSEMALLNRIQEFCYDNMNFLKIFNKIVLLLYKTDVLSEEVILKWYKDSHSTRGWSAFMEQMKKFVEWLEQADEESDEDDDED